MFMSARRGDRGFTLVELLIVIAIIGVLAAVAIPIFLSQVDKADRAGAESDLNSAYKMLLTAQVMGETLPAELPAGTPTAIADLGTVTPSATISIFGTGQDMCLQLTMPNGDVLHRGAGNVGDGDCANNTGGGGGGGATDTDGDGYSDTFETQAGSDPNDAGSDPTDPSADYDLDGDINSVDTDDDNDGCTDSLEASLALRSGDQDQFDANAPLLDFHIVRVNGNDVYLPVPGDVDSAVLYYDTSGVCNNSFTSGSGAVNLGTLPAGTTVRAIFDWDNRVGEWDMDWIDDVLQFGYNSNTGERNQIAHGYYAFGAMLPATLTALPGLDISNLSSTNSMFTNAASFNQDLSGWDTSGITDMAYMFDWAESFDQPLNSWNVSNVTTMRNMLAGSAFNQPLNNWNTANVLNMGGLFGNTPFNQDISGWNTSGVTNMASMFAYAAAFDQDISGWNVGSVTIYTDFDLDANPSWTAGEKPSFP